MSHSSHPSTKEERLRTVQEAAEKNRALLSQKNVFSYLRASITGHALYERWLALLRVIRRARLVVLLLRIASFLLSVLETGALLIVSVLLLLVLLPFATALLPGFLLAAWIESKKSNRFLKKQIKEKRIYLLFLPTEGGDFLLANAKSLASRPNCAVLLISPYLLSRRGLDRKGRFYLSHRIEEKNLFLLRRWYFVSFRRHILNLSDAVFLY